MGHASSPAGRYRDSNSLASGGALGGSQAGARLFYNISPTLAVVLRSSSDVGRRGGEVAGGIRYRPVRTVPVWLTAERRQALGHYGGGRSDFALFAEGGIYDRPVPWGFPSTAMPRPGLSACAPATCSPTAGSP